MLRVLVLLLLTLIACSPDRPTTTAFIDVDSSADPQQTQDRPGTQWSDLNAAAPKAGTSSSAWIEPSPASFSFTADDSAWKTFTVRTSSDVDSVLVVVNPTGKDRALEVAGGSRPPSRNYCPAEGNDSPTRARRNGWPLHLSACAVGDTEIVIFDYEQTELARYTVQVAEAEAGTSSSAWIEPSPASFSFTADDSAWKTFTVRTSSDVDSILVVANPTGKDKVLEVAGGSRPPSRNYCPAEGNDSPTRARRDEWSLYLSVCEAGDTEIVIFDYEQTELARYAIQVAEAEGQFNIVLLFDDLVPEDEKILFLQAADLWEEVIVGDIPDITLPEWWSSDSDLTPDNSSIDDLHISIHHIDYHPSIAGASGGPLFLREGSSLPATGAIWYESDELREHYKQNEHFFESAFLAQNARENQIRQMALHEIGHVLGFGTIPNWHKLLADIGEQWGGAKGATGDDAHFTDPNTIEAFNALPGPIFKGSPVPTNRSGVHWRGLILPEDVMGGHGSPAVKRISTVTLESLASLGYEVDLSKVGEIQRWENGYPLFFEEGYDPTRDQPPYSFPYSSKPVAAQITPIWTCTVGKE